MAWTVGRIRGIPVRIHWSLLLVLPFFAYIMAQAYFGQEGSLDARALAWGTALAVTLFLSVLLHELAHSLVALRLGGRVRSILLMPLGGVSHIDHMPDRPRHEFLVTIVGPLTNFVLAAPMLAAALLGVVPERPAGLPEFVRWAGVLNAAVGAFNLVLPAFPLDGGRLLRSALSARYGPAKATRWAASTGRVLAIGMAAFGVLSLARGGLWLVLIAFFIYLGAGAEEKAMVVRTSLQGVYAKDLMSPDPAILRPDDLLGAAHEAMLRTRHLALPVLDGQQPVGCLGLEELAQALMEGRAAQDARVRDVMGPAPPVVAPTASAQALLRVLEPEGHGHVLVADQDAVLGIVSRTDVERAVRILATIGAR